MQLVQHNKRPAPAREAPPAPVQNAPVSQPDAVPAPGADVFIPSSPVSGVVYSTSVPGRQSDAPEMVIKSGNYRLYQLNGSAVSREAGEVGGKLDLKG
jgi:hypothetical protein